MASHKPILVTNRPRPQRGPFAAGGVKKWNSSDLEFSLKEGREAMNNRTKLTLAWACAIVILMSAFQCDVKAEDNDKTLQALLKQIDAKLYEQSESDVRKLLDATIEEHWSKQGHTVAVNWDTGGLGCLAGMWFRGWEMLGEERYREASLDFADAIIQTQHDNGLFPANSSLARKGKSTGGAVATFEDEYHFGQFAVLAYAYKISGDDKYLRAVVKHADVIRSIQDPAGNKLWLGPWPHSYGGKDVKPQKGHARTTGYVLNDYTTYNGIQMRGRRSVVFRSPDHGDRTTPFVLRLDTLTRSWLSVRCSRTV